MRSFRGVGAAALVWWSHSGEKLNHLKHGDQNPPLAAELEHFSVMEVALHPVFSVFTFERWCNDGSSLALYEVFSLFLC